ncbi:tyrosine-type recombinase/integrase [Microbacterium lacus]|uniref:tyrosine-type recombinase/integrase n=1 Tax=Microbacterium lacus TaxID=415217 RepID=UPI001E3018EA|nr:site-specific integrase [Microbacterium lacus]
MLFLVTGILVLIAATVTISPVWLAGPSDPANASAGRLPGWYTGLIDGALRLVPPGWEVCVVRTHVDPCCAGATCVAGVFLLVRFLAYTGLRWGEAAGLRVRNCDLVRRRVLVVDNAVMVGTTVVVGTPKSHKSRSVPIPAFLNSELERLTRGKPDTAYLFGTGEAPVRLPNSKDGWFASAVRRAQKIDATFPRVTPHDLRHSAASLAVSAGANVKAVQRMLGHASAAMTLDVYSDLFDDDLDAVADRLDRARFDSNVGKMWAEGLSSE